MCVTPAEQPVSKIVCLPGLNKGALQLLNYGKYTLANTFKVADKSITLGIQAHDEVEIAAMAVNNSGTLVASASERGHIIKIFNTDQGACVQELKRGTTAALISQLVFHPTELILACSSKANPTVHLFEIYSAV